MSSQFPFVSAEVEEMLSVTYAKLHSLIRRRKIASPPKDRSGRYRWFKEHIEAARKVISARPGATHAD